MQSMLKKACLVLAVPQFPEYSEIFILNQFPWRLERGWDIHVVCTKSNLDRLPDFIQEDTKDAIRRRVQGFRVLSSRNPLRIIQWRTANRLNQIESRGLERQGTSVCYREKEGVTLKRIQIRPVWREPASS